MKKTIWLILVLCVILGLCSACAVPEPVETTAATTTEATTTEATTAETTTAATTTEVTAETTTAATTTEATTTEATTAKTYHPSRTVPVETQATEPLYSDVRMPGLYRMPISDASDEVDAAEKLTAAMLDSMKSEDAARSFCITEYKDVSVEVLPSSTVLDSVDGEFSYGSPVVSENAWLVNPKAAFKFTGIYAPIGPPIDDRWWEGLYQGGATPMILIKTDSEYLMWWSTQEESCPVEILQLGTQLDKNIEAEELICGIEEVPGLYRLPISEQPDRKEAAKAMCTELLDSLCEPGEDRTFCIDEYELLEIRVQAGFSEESQANQLAEAAGIALDSENTWLVSMQIRFDFTGVYAPFDSRWQTVFDLQNPAQLILIETDSEYLMWWSTVPESAPAELLG